MLCFPSPGPGPGAGTGEQSRKQCRNAAYQKSDEDIMGGEKSNKLLLKEANFQRSLVKAIRHRQPQFS
ncbi:hypothetical protein PoB_006890000 [Plakobranchus ocellatus]|uniref:Uncharacterized protein n=1 Tax=Plakobranchus ocellatus TaxID=259542 RepID=A0AAV4DEF0_9GAST|nr:hypothetical protein PoB_006890000 [Plakobranchus ocellatus]